MTDKKALYAAISAFAVALVDLVLILLQSC